ncbi:hypothetical protein J7L29_08355 [Candidatus Bathyarchaeota archaeon]|nr:hypothetical protein [Candidatus Bathyarchaeota archaeon]
MVKVEKTVVYFSEPDPTNTEDVINAVLNRLKEGDLKEVVVASTSGKTGVKFIEALKGKAKVIAVSEPYRKMKEELKDKIIEAGGIAIDDAHLPLHEKGMDDIRKTFYTLGQGFKVAVEVILIAAERGVISLYKDVVGVGGTGRGADTALVARATPTKEIFSKDKTKKLEIREIIAMPLKKKWWS